MPDWAVATARGAQIWHARPRGHPDPGGARRGARHRRAPRGRDALALAGDGRAAPNAVPTALLLELAPPRGRLRPCEKPRRARAPRQPRPGRRGRVARANAAHRKEAPSSPAALAAFDGGLDDAADGLQVADLASRARGATTPGSGSSSSSRSSRRTGPTSGRAWRTELALRARRRGQGRRGARRARELAPGEARYRAELALCASARRSRGTGRRTHDDERYLVPSADASSRGG